MARACQNAGGTNSLLLAGGTEAPVPSQTDVVAEASALGNDIASKSVASSQAGVPEASSSASAGAMQCVDGVESAVDAVPEASASTLAVLVQGVLEYRPVHGG